MLHPSQLLELINSNVQNKYLAALIIFLSGIILSKIAQFIVAKVIKRITRATKTDVDNMIVEKAEGPFFTLLVLFVIWYTLTPFGITGGVFQKGMSTVIILLVAHACFGIIKIIIDHWLKDAIKRSKLPIEDTIMPLIDNTVGVLIYTVGIIMVLDAWDVQIGPFLASLGIAGLAIGFAVKDSLSNIFGGIQMIFDKVYKVGDIIKLDSGEMGTVYDIGLRSTKMKTFDGEIMTVPNAAMANAKITNRYQPDNTIKVKVLFGVEYGSDPEKVKKLVLKEIKSVDGALKDPEPSVFFTDMGDFSLNFRAQFYIDAKETSKLGAKDEAVSRIYRALNKSRIGIPFPTRTLYMRKK